MALLHMSYFSTTLDLNTDLNILLPSPEPFEDAKAYVAEGDTFPILYLLHGTYGDYTDWVRKTNIDRYSHARHMIVVMPSCDNSFFQNMDSGHKYLDFMTKELPQYIEHILPVSKKREEHFVAGLSMGGYGAVLVAMENPEYFSAAASLSGVIDFYSSMEDRFTNLKASPWPFKAIFGENGMTKEALTKPPADIFARIEALRKAGRPVPRIYQTVGTEDFTYQNNLQSKAKLEALNVDLTYVEHHGVHDWNFWDSYIPDAMDWMMPGRVEKAPGWDD